jgi:hypothetical protein
VQERHAKDIIPEPATLVARAEAMIPALKRTRGGRRGGPQDSRPDHPRFQGSRLLRHTEAQALGRLRDGAATSSIRCRWPSPRAACPAPGSWASSASIRCRWACSRSRRRKMSGPRIPSVLVSSSYQPVGKVEKGRWRLLPVGPVELFLGLPALRLGVPGRADLPGSRKGPPEYRTFLVPRSDYEIVDTWHTYRAEGDRQPRRQGRPRLRAGASHP